MLKQYTKTSDHYKLFLKLNASSVKIKCKGKCDVLWYHQTKYNLSSPSTSPNNLDSTVFKSSTQWCSWLRHWVRPPVVPLECFTDVILSATLWPWSQLSSQQKWVPGTLYGDKGGQCIGLTTLPPTCIDCLEIWKPQPPVQVWTEIALL